MTAQAYDHWRDKSWRRLPWLLPLAALLALVTLGAFIQLLTGSSQIAAVKPLELDLVELPPSPVAAPTPLTPPPVAAPETPPPVAEPEPPPVQPPPPEPEPVPEPQPVLQDAPPPPPRKPRPPPRREAVRQVPPAPPVAAPPPAAAVPAVTAPPAVPPPGSGRMSARAIYQPMPTLPDELRRRNLEAVAVARFHVAADGSATVELVQPTADPMLNRALLDTLKTWRFFPAIAEGRPAASTLEIRIPVSVR